MKIADDGFYRSVKNDPLFAAEGMDLDRGVHALDAFEFEIRRFESLLSKTSLSRRLFLIRYPLSEYAIPIRFIRSFIECERARRMYLSEPSRKKADHLSELWIQAAGEFSSSVDRYVRLHRILFRLEKDAATFEFNDLVGQRTSLTDITRSLDVLRGNASALKAEARIRSELLRDAASYKEEKRAFDPLPVYASGEVKPEHALLYQWTIDDLRMMDDPTTVEMHGPLWYTVSNFDEIPTPHLFTFRIGEDPASGMRAAMIDLVDRYYFLPIDGPRSRFGNIGRSIFETLIQKGIRYWFQPGTFLYMSRDQRYWADIMTIVDRKRRPHLDISATEVQRSSLLDLLLGTCVTHAQANYNNTAERIERNETGPSSFLFDLLMRSHPSIHFLTFNRSVWRSAEEPHFKPSGRTPAGAYAYITEKEFLAEAAQGEIEKVMHSGTIRRRERKKGHPDHSQRLP